MSPHQAVSWSEDRRELCAVADTRLQFLSGEGKPTWVADLVRELQRFEPADDEVLHGTYASSVEADFDTENIVLGNVGAACFAQSCKCGVRFERSFRLSPIATRVGATHEQRYRLARLGEAFQDWQRGPLIATVGPVELERVSTDMSPALVWHAVHQGQVTIHRIAPRERLVAELVLSGPTAGRNTASLIKPVLDGLLSALHRHSHPEVARDVAARIAPRVKANADVVFERLVSDRRAALGPRRFAWLRGEGTQWGPADDLCVACEMRLDRKAAEWSLSAVLHQALEVAPG